MPSASLLIYYGVTSMVDLDGLRGAEYNDPIQIIEAIA